MFLGRSYLVVGSGVLFQQKGRQFLAQQTGQVLTLRKRQQLILVRLGKHALEGLSGSQQPALAQGFPILPMQK
jgi:hypothetical protein